MPVILQVGNSMSVRAYCEMARVRPQHLKAVCSVLTALVTVFGLADFSRTIRGDSSCCYPFGLGRV
jgi:hypothetical protein